MLLAAGAGAGAGDLDSGLDPRRQPPPTRHDHRRGRAPPSAVALLPPTATETALAHDPPYRGPGRRGRDGRRSFAAAHYHYPPPAGTAAAAPLFGRRRRRNSTSNLALHDAAATGYSFRDHPGAAMGGVAHDHPMMQSAAAAGRFSHDQHQGRPSRARGEGGGRDRRLSAQHAGGRTPPRSPLGSHSHSPPKNTSTSPQHQYLNGGGHPLPPQPHLQAPPPRLSPPQPSSNLIVDPDLLVLDMRAYGKLEDAIVRVKLFLENVRHLAMERGLDNLEDGHEPSLFVSIITGECGDGTPGTILQSVLQKIFVNQEIQFFVSADGQSLQVDALGGFPEEEVDAVDDAPPPIATATVPVPAPKAADDRGRPGADRGGINPRDCDDDVPHNDDRLPAPIDEHRNQQPTLMLEQARAAEEEVAAIANEAAAMTGNVLSLARSREEEAGSVGHHDDTPSNLAGDQSHTRTPFMLSENEEERHRVMLLTQAELLQRGRLENLANADANNNTAAGSGPSQPVTREPPSPPSQQLMQAELLQRGRLEDLADANSNSTNASVPALSPGAMPSQPGTTTQHLQHPYPQDRGTGLLYGPPDSIAHSLLRREAGGTGSVRSESPESDPYYNALSGVPTALGRAVGLGRGRRGMGGHGIDGGRGGGGMDGHDIEDGRGSGRGHPWRDPSSCRMLGDSSQGILGTVDANVTATAGAPCDPVSAGSPVGDDSLLLASPSASSLASTLTSYPEDHTRLQYPPHPPLSSPEEAALRAALLAQVWSSHPASPPGGVEGNGVEDVPSPSGDGFPSPDDHPVAVLPLPEQGRPRPGRRRPADGVGGGAGDPDVRQAIAESQASHNADAQRQVTHDIQFRRALERMSEESARDAGWRSGGVSGDGAARDDEPEAAPQIGEEELVRRASRMTFLNEQRRKREVEEKYALELEQALKDSERLKEEEDRILQSEEELVRSAIVKTRAAEEEAQRNEEDLLQMALVKSLADDGDVNEGDLVEEAIRTSLAESTPQRSMRCDSGSDNKDGEEELEKVLKLSLEEKEHVPQMEEVLRLSLEEKEFVPKLEEVLKLSLEEKEHVLQLEEVLKRSLEEKEHVPQLEEVLKRSLEEKEHVPQLEEVLKLSLEEKEHVPRLEEVLKLSLEEKEHTPLEELENLKKAMEWSAMEECASMEGCGTFRGEFGDSSAKKTSEWDVQEYEEEKCDRTRSGQDAAGLKRPSQRGMDEYEETFCGCIRSDGQCTAGPKKSSEGSMEEYREMKDEKSNDEQDPPLTSPEALNMSGVQANSIGDNY